MAKPGACHKCLHWHPTMASASKGEVTRWFCHEDDHSCYNDMRGRYFDDERAWTEVTREAGIRQTGEPVIDFDLAAAKVTRALGQYVTRWGATVKPDSIKLEVFTQTGEHLYVRGTMLCK